MAPINQYYPENVTHPGEILAEALGERNISARGFSARSGKPEEEIAAILEGKSPVTPGLASVFENILGIPARFWMEAQKNFDTSVARIASGTDSKI